MNRMLYTYGAMVSLGAIGYAGYELIDWRCLTATEWAAWVGAIGTLLAFAGTIWIAFTGERIRTRQARLRAHISGASLFYAVATAHQRVTLILAVLSTYQAGDQGDDHYIELRDTILELEIWNREDLEPLVDFDPNVVGVLIHAENGVRLAKRGFKNYESMNDPRLRVAFMLSTKQILDDANEFVRKATVGLDKYRGVEAGNLVAVHGA